jgi:hypothetical protein
MTASIGVNITPALSRYFRSGPHECIASPTPIIGRKAARINITSFFLSMKAKLAKTMTLPLNKSFDD